MKAPSKIIGLVQAKCEWPLLALSISHALMHHVDEVYVLNHLSADESVEGIAEIQELWQDRVHIFNFHDEHYWQEASTNLLIEMCRSKPTDWIYVFDADEFILTQNNKPLRDVLDGIDPKYSVVKYDVQNWISNVNFDETRIDHYRTLRYRSIPSLLNADIDDIIKGIEQGDLNYFDVQLFYSKVIFRNGSISWLSAGAHFLKEPTDISVCNIDSNELRVAHFPLLSRNRLQLKAEHGMRLIQDGFSAYHGWQGQIIYRLFKSGLLDEFWNNHAITSDNPVDDKMSKLFDSDDSFVLAIEPVLAILENKYGSCVIPKNKELRMPYGKSYDTEIPFIDALMATHKFQTIADSLRQERDALIRELNALVNSRTWRYTRFIRVILKLIVSGNRDDRP